MQNVPKVSVIIPVYNGVATLPSLLAALQHQTYPERALEIIVADNNSDDGSDQLVTQCPNIQIVYERRIQNAGAARNRALEAATGEIVAFTDADCIPTSDWVKQGVNSLIHNQRDRIAGAIQFAPLSSDSSAPALLDAMYNLDQRFVVERFQAAVTANLFVKRSIFEQIGPFPTDYFEDMQWNRRASAAGFSLMYASEAIVQHPPRDSLAAVWEKGRRSGRGVFAICDVEKRGGWFGIRHILRMGRILLVPRSLNWDRLPFPVQELSSKKRLEIRILMWLTINVAEMWGYGQWWLRSRWQPRPPSRSE